MHGIEQNIIATSRRSVAASPQASSPAPWRIVEIAHGFVVDDAAGRQLGVFDGRDDSNTAGHTGFLTIDEAHRWQAISQGCRNCSSGLPLSRKGSLMPQKIKMIALAPC